MTKFSLGAILALVGASCIHRTQVAPERFRVPKTFTTTKAKTASATEAVPAAWRSGEWWKLFRDAQLDELIKRAFLASPELEQMRARVKQGHARLMLATGNLLPNVNGQAIGGRRRQAFSSQFQFEANQIRLSLAAGYEFNLGGRDIYARDAAQHEVLAAQLDYVAARITLTANVVDAYFLIAEQRAQLNLMTRAIANRKAQLKLISRRYRLGVATALELYQGRENLAVAQAQRALVEGRLNTAKHALAVLLGQYPGTMKAGSLDALPAEIAELPTGVPGQLIMRRPGLKAGLYRLLAADERVGEAFAAHFPTLGLTGSLGQNFDPSGFVWDFLGQLTAPLFQGGRIRAQVKLQKAFFEEQRAGFRVTLLRAVQEIEDAVATGDAVKKRLKWLTEQVDAAENAVRLATDQYVQGLTPYLNVLTSERTLVDAQSQLIAARRELITARVQLARALGGSWNQRENEGQEKGNT